MISPLLGLGLCFLFAIIIVVLPKQEFSEAENRKLEYIPSISQQTFFEQDFMKQWNQYLSDHFPARELIAKWNNYVSIFLGEPKINNVFVLEERLVENVSNVNPITSKRNTQAINDFAANYPEVPMYFSLIPTATEIYRDKLPQDPNIMDQIAVINDIYGESKNKTIQKSANEAAKQYDAAYGVLENVSTIDIHTALIASKQQNIFYKTDTCWTSMGAYIGYNSLITSMGGTAVSRDLFNIKYMQNEYFGNLYQKTLMKVKESDRIELYSYAPEVIVDSVQCYDGHTPEEYDSLYFDQYINTPQAMNVFLGNSCDDYSKPLLQFLSLHYKTIMFVNLEQISKEQLDLIVPNEFDVTLFLYNIKNYVSNTSIATKLLEWGS